MNKNLFAQNPPMGWNSYDYYDTTVNESQIRENAEYMSRHLKEYGWEYIVVDIEWYSYDAGTQRDKHQYIPFWKVEMDAYSRLLPCPDRFPSSRDGKGFQPLADYVHSLGLKFGIHIMRGIPRQAAHQHTSLLGSEKLANEIANPSSICYWNPDMYGVNTDMEEAQLYYNSIFELYAHWGVDFIKCDDICRYDSPSSRREIEMLHHAINYCGRPMVLSLSPGPALIDKAWHYEKYANMWRITDDFWDNWPLLKNMFERCELWQNHVSVGCYPDCDMLPLGYLGKGFSHERYTNFSKDEQITMMTLWSIFRSPMMLGAELTKLDEWTLSLLTNERINYLLTDTKNAKQVMRSEAQAVWMTEDVNDTTIYVALFNLSDKDRVVEITTEEMCIDSLEEKEILELWNQENLENLVEKISVKIPIHGARIYSIK